MGGCWVAGRWASCVGRGREGGREGGREREWSPGRAPRRGGGGGGGGERPLPPARRPAAWRAHAETDPLHTSCAHASGPPRPTLSSEEKNSESQSARAGMNAPRFCPKRMGPAATEQDGPPPAPFRFGPSKGGHRHAHQATHHPATLAELHVRVLTSCTKSIKLLQNVMKLLPNHAMV